MTLTSGQVLQNRYRIVSSLGEGGMGAVYRAWDTRLNVPVALKELVPQPGLDSHTLAQLRRQFEQEAQVLARLDHPHLVRVTDFFSWQGSEYLVMNFVAGESLANLIAREGALPEAEVLVWAEQLLDALGYCHAQGIIHRDVKPQNVIITPSPTSGEGRGGAAPLIGGAGRGAVLVDFGLVKLWDPGDPRTKTAMRGMGTPEYAPPEQYDIQMGHTGPRSDIYGLGATLYHALTGQSPLTATMRMADPEQFALLRSIVPGVSERTEAAVLKAVELARSQRWQSAAEMAQALGVAIPAWGAEKGAVPTAPPLKARGGTRKMEDADRIAVPSAQAAMASVATPVAEPIPVRRKRVPAWVWVLGGLAVLALVMGVVMALRGGREQPVVVTKVMEVEVTTTPAAVVMAEATNTPQPTNTPRSTTTTTPQPTPLPAATIDAIPDVYDSFDDPSNDGNFDQSKWILWSDFPSRVVQQDGVLMVSADIETEGGASLGARQYEDVTLSTLTANNPTFVEAKLRLSPDEHAGNVSLNIGANLEGWGWFSECNIMDYGDIVSAGCFDTRWPWQEGYQYNSEEQSVDLGTWHKVRIELDPASMTFTYYVDDQMVGSHVPADADKLRDAKFTVSIGVWGNSSESVKGYIDDVRIGQITPPATILYDDFDDATYDGTINPTKWELDLPEVCDVAQQEGAMVFKNAPLQNHVDCVLSHPSEVSVDDLGVMEAQIKMSSDHNGGTLNQGINFTTCDLPGGTWWAFCGLLADADGVRSLLDVHNYGGRDESDIWWESPPADYDQWYTFRLEVDSDTMTVSCFVDDKLLASIVPRDASELRSARFSRNLDAWRSPGSFATTYVDDVQIGQVGQ